LTEELIVAIINSNDSKTLAIDSDKTRIIDDREGEAGMQYIVFIGIILLISWGVRILIHFDTKKRREEICRKGDADNA